MPDVFTRAKRSEVMGRIPGRGNKSTERRMAAILRSGGVRGWRLHARDIPGRPDIYFSQARLAIFVDGCFWHGCPSCYNKPATNKAFWAAKYDENQRRDRAVEAQLATAGILVIRIWEHELADRATRLHAIIRVREALTDR